MFNRITSAGTAAQKRSKCSILARPPLLLAILLLSAVLLSSCGYEKTRFNCGEYPFIVGKIQSYDDSLCEYSAKKFNASFSDLFGGKATFIAKPGLYQIGDTVKLSNCH